MASAASRTFASASSRRRGQRRRHAATGSGGPTLTVHADLPEPGEYRTFIQFQNRRRPAYRRTDAHCGPDLGRPVDADAVAVAEALEVGGNDGLDRGQLSRGPRPRRREQFIAAGRDVATCRRPGTIRSRPVVPAQRAPCGTRGCTTAWRSGRPSRSRSEPRMRAIVASNRQERFRCRDG